VVYPVDLRNLHRHHWVLDLHVYPVERQRGYLALISILMICTGERPRLFTDTSGCGELPPGEVVNVKEWRPICYEHLRLSLCRDEENPGGRPIFRLEIEFSCVKGFEGGSPRYTPPFPYVYIYLPFRVADFLLAGGSGPCGKTPTLSSAPSFTSWPWPLRTAPLIYLCPLCTPCTTWAHSASRTASQKSPSTGKRACSRCPYSASMTRPSAQPPRTALCDIPPCSAGSRGWGSTWASLTH